MSDGISHGTECLSGNIAAQIEQKRAGRRKHVRHGGTLCSKCLDNPPVGNGQRYCAPCHAEAVSASYYRRKAELERLRALERQIHG